MNTTDRSIRYTCIPSLIRLRETSGSGGGLIISEGDEIFPTLADVHRALGATRRYHAIHLLMEFDDAPIQASNLADHITAIEVGIPPSSASGDSYHNVYNGLCQTHLPALDDVGDIRYDSDRKTLTIGPRYPVVKLLLGLNRTAYTILQANSGSSTTPQSPIEQGA